MTKPKAIAMSVSLAWQDFVRWEKASGGPDPHVTIASKIAAESQRPEWFCGLFCAAYTVAGAEALSQWEPEAAAEHPDELREWCRTHWEGLPVRKERRTNGTGPDKLAEIVHRYGKWVCEGRLAEVSAAPTFDAAFGVLTKSTWNYGHYFGLKLYETMRRAGLPLPWPIDDIRPKGGAFARRGLALLYPKHDPRDDSRFALDEANQFAYQEMANLALLGVPVSCYEVEVLFCNFRQAVNGGQYPGRAHDSELAHTLAVEKYWRWGSEVRRWRQELFPPFHMGELGGWSGRRGLAECMTKHGYVWSDLLYDYARTVDLANPVRWRPVHPIEEE